MESRQRLDKFITVVVPASGIGFSLPIGPTLFLERWDVQIFSIQTTGNLTTNGEVFVYRGPVSRINQVDYTAKIEGDTSDTDVTLRAGDFLNFEWRNCTPGAIGTAHIVGDRYVAV